MSVRAMLQLTLATAVDASTRGAAHIWHVLHTDRSDSCFRMHSWGAIASHTPWHISTGKIPQAHGLCEHQSRHLFLTLTLTLAPVLQ